MAEKRTERIGGAIIRLIVTPPLAYATFMAIIANEYKEGRDGVEAIGYAWGRYVVDAFKFIFSLGGLI